MRQLLDLEARRAEAASAHTEPWRLAELASDPDARVRREVAENPAASDTTLSRLRTDSDRGVRVSANVQVAERAAR